MADSKSNYFDLPDPDSLYCTVWFQRAGHPLLLVRLHQGGPETVGWLAFYLPQYFEGPFNWRGAGFKVATLDRESDIVRALIYADKDDLVENYRLFSVPAQPMLLEPSLVRIVAMRGKFRGAEEFT